MENQNDNTVNAEIDLNEVMRIRREKLARLINIGENPYEEVKYEKDAYARNIKDNFEGFEGKTVSLAGRILSKRLMGKASFLNISDETGGMQLYLRSYEMPEDFEKFKEFDIGDVIGVKGKVFKTRTGEISVHLSFIKLLSKSLLPLPEKFHGLKDPDLRYRQRYVDLIANPEVKDVFVLRSKIIKALRDFIDSKGFIEVETPVLNVIAGGAAAKPFITKHNTLDMNMFLRIAPELYLKRLIVGGFEKVYEIGRVFRNEGMSVRHNPEFTIFELYQAYADYTDMLNLTESIYKHIAQSVFGRLVFTYQGAEVDLGEPFKRLTMVQAVREYTGLDFDSMDAAQARKALAGRGIDVPKNGTWGGLLYLAFDNFVEDKLIRPAFILDYPIEVSPLAKAKKADKRLTERFEFFLCGREMGNAYSELNDPIDQKERFTAQVKAKEAGDEEAHSMDEDFVTALEYAMPPTGGLGLGIDRMVMFFTDSFSIRDVLLFPTMKPKKS